MEQEDFKHTNWVCTREALDELIAFEKELERIKEAKYKKVSGFVISNFSHYAPDFREPFKNINTKAINNFLVKIGQPHSSVEEKKCGYKRINNLIV